MDYDRYTRPLATKHLRTRDVKLSGKAHMQNTSVCNPDLNRQPVVPAMTLVAQLEGHIADTEKKWRWIAASFDTELLASDVPREVAAAPSGARLPMPRPLSPFSLSSVFLRVNTPDSSTTTDEDTSAGDLSLYRWLSAQGAQTILPGRSPVFTPPPKRVSALNHLSKALPTPGPEKARACAPLSPPPSSRLLFSAQFDTPEQPLPLRAPTHSRVEVEKPAPFLPVSPPATPVTTHFGGADEAAPAVDDPFTDAAEADLNSLASFDLDLALSRNLSLQHASMAAVRSYRLVMQELKSASSHCSTVPRIASTRPHPTPDTVSGPALGSNTACKLACPQTERAGRTPQDNNTDELAALLTRQAADEEVQAEQLRALAARLQDVARQRRHLAASVLAGHEQHAV